MKLISLNAWCGMRYKPLMEFIRRQAKTTDIFCFQEMIFGGKPGPITKYKIRGQLFDDISAILPKFRAYTHLGPPGSKFWADPLPEDARIGQAIFVRKDIPVMDDGGAFLYSGDPFHGSSLGLCTGNLHYVRLNYQKKFYTIGNVHGLWQQHKDDTPERFDQSRRLIAFFRAKTGKKILVGDFNIRPETKAIAMLSKEMRNLVAEHKVATTRTREYRDMNKWKDYIADYAFISKNVELKDFKVLPDVASDHSPLMVEFS